MDSRHALLVPIEGDPVVLHSEVPIDDRSLLEERGEGVYVSFDLKVDEAPRGKFSFLVNESSPPNEAARLILAMVTGGVHMVLIGEVCFLGLTSAEIAEVQRQFT